MNRCASIYRFTPGFVVLLVTTVTVFSNPLPSEDTAAIPREDVKVYYKVMQRMDGKVGDLFGKLVTMFGVKDFYTPAEVQWAIGPKKSKEELIYSIEVKRPLPIPRGAISRTDAHSVLRVHAARTESKEDLVKALIEKYGYLDTAGDKQDQLWYLASEIRDVEENGAKKAKILEFPPDPTGTGFQPVVDGIRHFKIRQSWSDLLYSEDPSLADDAKKKIDDLVGASFSYTHNFDTDRNDWSAVGSVIFPMEWKNAVERNGIPERVVLAPSVSINRVTNADPKKETDEMYYRLGGIAKWIGPEGALDVIQLRGAGVYGTDTENEARLPAYEVELEPQITWLGINNTLNDYFKIGFKNVLLSKRAELADGTDDSFLDYQCRVWLRSEGGDLQRAGTKWNVVEGSFVRAGPAMQFRLNAPTIWKGLSFTALYSYLPTFDGPDDHSMLLKLDGTITLSSDPVSRQKISLNANYTRGGLDFTKQEVETFTLGLSVLF
jgi:hypothetical protein